MGDPIVPFLSSCSMAFHRGCTILLWHQRCMRMLASLRPPQHWVSSSVTFFGTIINNSFEGFYLLSVWMAYVVGRYLCACEVRGHHGVDSVFYVASGIKPSMYSKYFYR